MESLIEPTEGADEGRVDLPNDHYTPDYPVSFQLEYIKPELHIKEVKELDNIFKPYNLSNEVKDDLTKMYISMQAAKKTWKSSPASKELDDYRVIFSSIGINSISFANHTKKAKVIKSEVLLKKIHELLQRCYDNELDEELVFIGMENNNRSRYFKLLFEYLTKYTNLSDTSKCTLAEQLVSFVDFFNEEFDTDSVQDMERGKTRARRLKLIS